VVFKLAVLCIMSIYHVIKVKEFVCLSLIQSAFLTHNRYSTVIPTTW